MITLLKKYRFLLLFLGYLIYSLGGVIAKTTSDSRLNSFHTIAYYVLVLIVLAVYSAIWQITLKNIDLSTAYMCKGSVILFGLIWAKWIFDEKITWNNMLGAAIVIAGILLYNFKRRDRSWVIFY